MSPCLFDNVFSEGGNFPHEGFPIELAIFHLVEFCFPVSCHRGRREGLDVHLIEKAYETLTLAGDVEIPTVPGEIFLPQEALDAAAGER